MSDVKIGTSSIIVQTGEILNRLNDMEKSTKAIQKKAIGYNDVISDGLMSDMVTLLGEIASTIDDIKEKSYKFTENMKEGAEDLEAAYRTSKRNTGKI